MPTGGVARQTQFTLRRGRLTALEQQRPHAISCYERKLALHAIETKGKPKELRPDANRVQVVGSNFKASWASRSPSFAHSVAYCLRERSDAAVCRHSGRQTPSLLTYLPFTGLPFQSRDPFGPNRSNTTPYKATVVDGWRRFSYAEFTEAYRMPL